MPRYKLWPLLRLRQFCCLFKLFRVLPPRRPALFNRILKAHTYAAYQLLAAYKQNSPIVTLPPGGMWTLSTCVSQKTHIQTSKKISVHVTCGHGLVLLWRQCNVLCISVLWTFAPIGRLVTPCGSECMCPSGRLWRHNALFTYAALVVDKCICRYEGWWRQILLFLIVLLTPQFSVKSKTLMIKIKFTQCHYVSATKANNKIMSYKY